LKKSIEKRFDKFEMNFANSVATFFDPRFKFSTFDHEETFLEVKKFIISNNFGSDKEKS